ncbi:MAG TPA: metallophosphoesterase [Terriglobia bacterium]
MTGYGGRLTAALGVIWLWVLSCTLPGPPAVAASGQTGGPDFQVDDRQLSHPLRIVVYGDMRFTSAPQKSEDNPTNPKVRRWLVEKIAAEKPDAVLLSGDVPWRGGEASDYDVYRAETKIWRDAHLRVYPALGNHEFKDGGERQSLENWWNAFPELRGRRWYSVQLGSSIDVLNLDSNSSLLPGSEQIAWLRDQLDHLPSTVRFAFFNLHHPPVVDVQKGGDADHNGRPNEKALADFLARAPQKSRVSFVVAAGHVHNYERFFQDDIVYLVSGGGGARPYPIVRGPQDLYQDTAFPNYHYVQFVESGDKLLATMIRVADPEASSPKWEEKDHFEIRPAAAAPGKAAAAKAQF